MTTADFHVERIAQKFSPDSLLASVMEAAIAGGLLLSGVTYLVSPDELARSVVGHAVGPFDSVWSWMYVFGAVAVLYGIVRISPRWRVAGLVLLTAGLLMQFVAAVSFEVSPRAFVSLIYALACGVRALLIARVATARTR